MAGRNVYYAWGYGGQFIFVVPEVETVIVTTASSNPGRGRHAHRAAVVDLVEGIVAMLSREPEQNRRRNIPYQVAGQAPMQFSAEIAERGSIRGAVSRTAPMRPRR